MDGFSRELEGRWWSGSATKTNPIPSQMRPQPNCADADHADAEEALSLISTKLIAITIAGQLCGEQALEV